VPTSASDYTGSPTALTAPADQLWLKSSRHTNVGSRVGHDQNSSYDQKQSDDVLAFRQFRRNVIGFLRLPLDVSEGDLRDALIVISPNLLAVYKLRATQATLAWASMCRSDLLSLQLRGLSDNNASPASRPHASGCEESVAAAS
jgi:hypothetical protein